MGAALLAALLSIGFAFVGPAGRLPTAVEWTGSGNHLGASDERSAPAQRNRGKERDEARGDRPPVGDQEPGDSYPEATVVYQGRTWCLAGTRTVGDIYAVEYGFCPSPGGGPPPPPSPLDAAYYVWHWETRLPAPTLSISPPDGAVTGLDLYLSLGGPQTRTFDMVALGHAVRLEVSSVYDVDWGDGTTTRRHAGQGGPYPSGDLRHQYTHRGEVTITVTQRWTARWQASGQSGVLADVLFTTGTRTLPVREIQAVVTG